MRATLFWKAAGVEARRTMAYRVDFWVEAVAVFAVALGVAWAVWTAVFEAAGVERLGGLDRTGTVVYFATALLVAKVVRGADLGDATVSGDVYEGGLSRYLLYPAPYAGLKYAQHLGGLAPALVQLALFGAPFLLLARSPTLAPTAGSLAMGLASMAVGNLLYWTMSFPLHGASFWAENVWSLLVALRFVSSFLGGAMAPLSAFPAWSRPWLDALPFRHLFAEPAETILGRRDVATWGVGLLFALGWTALFAVVAAVVFRRGRLRYTGPGL